MSIFDFATKPQTRELPVEHVERLAKDQRLVIPTERPQNYQPDQVTEELMERYFQVKPMIHAPTITISGATYTVLISSIILGLVGLFGIGYLHAFSLLLLLIGLGGIAGGLYWIYQLYEPMRTYLLPLESYLLRNTLSFQSFEDWQESKLIEIFETTAKRLHISLADLTKTGRGERVITDPRLIAGYKTQGTIRSRTRGEIGIYAARKSPIPFVDSYRQRSGTIPEDASFVASVSYSLFDIADHVEYISNGNSKSQSHWRITNYLLVLPQDDALAVYETTIDAINLQITGDTTSEYFYQSVLGLQTRVSEINPLIKSQQTEFTLLIGHGFSPSITTARDLDKTIRVLRSAISEKKALALRREVEGARRVTVPLDDDET